MSNSFQHLIFKEHNETYTWKIPSPDYDINEIKNAQHGESFKSPTFSIQSFDCYFELFPNGCNDRTKGQIMLYICFRSIPLNIASIFSSFKLLLKETNTVSIKRYRFSADKPFSNWKRGTLELNKIKDLQQLTFGIVMNIDKIQDLAGNVILNHDVDVNKETLMQQLVFQQHNYEEAIAFLNQQIEIKNHIQFDPQSWFYEVGIELYKNDQYQKCIECCLKAKSDGDEIVVIAGCYRYLGDYKKAIYYYQQYLLQYPDQPTAISDVAIEIGKVWYENREYQKAIEHFSKCQSKNCPGDELLYIAIAYHDMADCKNAIKYYEEYMEKYPSLPTDVMNVPLNLGVVYRNIKDFKNAKKYFLQATELGQGKDGALQEYTSILSDIEDNYEEALETLLRYFDEYTPEHFIEIASIYHKMGKRSKSNEFWIKGLIKHKDNFRLNMCYGDYLGSIGKSEQSLYYYYKVHNLDEYRVDTLISILKTLKVLNKMDEAISIINKIQNLVRKEYENKVDYKYDRSSDKYRNLYYRQLYASRTIKIRTLTDYQFQTLGCLQSMSSDYRSQEELFENILNFTIEMIKEYSDQNKIVKICAYLLYAKHKNQLFAMYDENVKIFDYNGLKTFALYFCELKQYEKSIEICLNCLQKLNDDNLLDKHENVSFYYLLCLIYSELNDKENYKKYHQLAIQMEAKFVRFDEWNRYFNSDENDGKYDVFGDEIGGDIKYDFDEQNDNHFEEPTNELIDKYDLMISKLKTKQGDEVEKEELIEDEKKEEIEIRIYNDNKEWEIINLWFDKAISISVHDMKWNELYIDCLLHLSKFNDAAEYVDMFDLYEKLNDFIVFQIGKHYYYKRKNARIALKYLNLLQSRETECVLFVKARCYRKLKNYSKSIQLYNKILNNDPFFINCIEDLCDVYLLRTSTLVAAQKLVYKALTIDHTHTGILNSFTGLLSRTLNAWSDAHIIHTKILNHKKHNYLYFNNAGYTFYKLNKITNALDLSMQDLIRIKKKNANLSTITVSNIGFYYYELYKKLKNENDKNYNGEKLRFYLDQSKKFLTFGLMIDDDEPSEFSHYFYANLLFFELKKYNFAKLYYENALSIHENKREDLFDFFDIDYQQQCCLNYAKLLRILKEYEKSNQYLDKAINFKMDYNVPNFQCIKPDFNQYNECYELMSLNYKYLGDDINSKLWLQKIKSESSKTETNNDT